VTESADAERDVGRTAADMLAGDLAALDDGVDEGLAHNENGSAFGHGFLLGVADSASA
jgi:hypothetical protein